MITVLHILAFFEFPSSLSWSSDITSRGDRIHFPCGVTEAIEILCLLLLIADAYIKVGVIFASDKSRYPNINFSSPEPLDQDKLL